MKYIRQQYFLTTVFDNDLITNEEIAGLLNTLRKSSADLFVEYRDERTGMSISNKQCRIRAVTKNTLDFVAFSKRGSIVMRNISFENLICVKQVAKTYNTMIDSHKTTKADLLDFDDGGLFCNDKMD